VLVAEPGKFLARHGVSDENWFGNLQLLHDGEDVIGEALLGVASFRMTGSAKTPTSDGIHVTELREFRSEVVVDMSGISGAGEKDDGTARASPIEYFETNISLDLYELLGVGRGVVPSRLGGREIGDKEESHYWNPHRLYLRAGIRASPDALSSRSASLSFDARLAASVAATNNWEVA